MLGMGARVISGLMFFPRGGSAYVARALARGLGRQGWEVTIVAGSRSDSPAGDARRFFAGLDVRPVDYGPALHSDEPQRYEGPPGTAPMHPSFEDRPGAADRVFAALDDQDFERQVAAWARELERNGAAEADALHLHHLTPINEAAARVAPQVPVIGHLHGTELLMLERIATGAPAAWSHADAWGQRMRAWAADCERLVVAPGGADRASALLGIDPQVLIELPNGFDPEIFRRRNVNRRAVWRRELVLEPRGWLPDQEPGSVSYREEDLEPLARTPVLVAVGRFTEVKRLGMLIAAHARARERLVHPAALVLIGGYPGEWEGEHPAETIARTGARDVYLAGWHDQEELPELLSAADVLIMPSAREHFGQVLVEAMACEVAPIAARSLGPESIIDDGRTGWLVPVNDERALADALVQAVNDDGERRRRATAAREAALRDYSWPAVAATLGAELAELVPDPPGVEQAAPA
jgi:glycosyltransferase involved in cell wall biosynthesis